MLDLEAKAIRHAPARPALRRLKLTDFRSYSALDLEVEASLVVLCGENGAGKTNVLESLSLLTPGRGLRRADMADFARDNGSGGFAISAEIEGPTGPVQLGTGVEPAAEGGSPQRKYRIDRVPVSSIRGFADHVRMVWQTPGMDGLFAGPAGDRRRFLDRLVLAVDAEHGSRVNALERALRNRNRLLEDGIRKGAWLEASEKEIAEIAVAVAAARTETVARLGALLGQTDESEASPFPWAEVALDGAVEHLAAERPALEAEDAYRDILRDNRSRDAAAGRTLIGPQSCDLLVRHGPKNMEAEKASTGEQKALLIGLILAHAQLVATMSGICPIILLDEVAAHFDPRRRQALFARLRALGAQVWVTGADPGLFQDVSGADTEFLTVTPGRVTRG
jgi:DNA replication and repair protein RecF